jgi:hypothetical protein
MLLMEIAGLTQAEIDSVIELGRIAEDLDGDVDRAIRHCKDNPQVWLDTRNGFEKMGAVSTIAGRKDLVSLMAAGWVKVDNVLAVAEVF